MIRLSIQARQALGKLTLPVMIAVAFGLMLLGKADTLLADRARMALADALSPIYTLLAQPVSSARAAINEWRALLSLRERADVRLADDHVGERRRRVDVGHRVVNRRRIDRARGRGQRRRVVERSVDR